MPCEAYFEAQLWGGRLPVPPEYAHTSIAKLFERGQIGGRTVQRRERFPDTEDGRRRLVLWVRQHAYDDTEIEFIPPGGPRQTVPRQQIVAPGFVAHGLRRR
jgi:hypothetical protein